MNPVEHRRREKFWYLVDSDHWLSPFDAAFIVSRGQRTLLGTVGCDQIDA